MKGTRKADIFLFRTICTVYLLSLIFLFSSAVHAATNEERLINFAKKASKAVSENDISDNPTEKTSKDVSKDERLENFAEKASKAVSENENTDNPTEKASKDISKDERLTKFAEKVSKAVPEDDRSENSPEKTSQAKVHTAAENDRLLKFAEKTAGITEEYGEAEAPDPRVLAFARKAEETEKEMEKKYGPWIVDHIKVLSPRTVNGTKATEDTKTTADTETTKSTGTTRAFPRENIISSFMEPFFTKPLPFFTDPDGKNGESLGKFRLTAYDACIICCGKTDGITKSGTHAKTGRTVAVDPNVIPLGSKIKINGHTYIAEDTGSAIKGFHIDIFLDTHEEAKRFGNRYAEVFLVE